jgi:hypothetical protein
MTVCGHRTETPGFFTPCAISGRCCACGAEVAAEVAAQILTDTPDDRTDTP